MAVSCQKNKQNPPAEPPVTNKTTKVKLKLTGDILLTESPLSNGRKIGDILSAARSSFGNNTLYAVGVRRQDGTEPLFTGLFTHPDSIYIDVPSSGQYNVSIHIYKKGTGGGLYYDLLDGFKYFPFPIGTELKNRMDSVVRFPYLMDQVAFTDVASLDSTITSLPSVIYPEVEYFQGDVDFIGSPYPAPIYISMMRRSFGIQFRATNFTEGELYVEFSRGPDALGGPVLADLRLTPANINSDYHILGSDDFRTSDSTQLVNVKLTLLRPDGSHSVIITKNIYFKRNVLTKLQLTFPEYSRAGIGLMIGETDWSGNETINL
ncbi:hypothetical protein [Chitinophaga sp. SYP-B3965]|uniref:hypothetical protein n=1 Tax=Chitinophaga sp. SYP-B3965 TaxID=2663120 RepID=UPI001566CB1E|nr:hypothetical protein [Chitinophaga sp. SYP-B3965]